MTRDTYDVTIRRASQLSHKLELFKSTQNSRRASQITKRSFLRENDFRGSERTLFESNLTCTTDSINSSQSNIQTSASCSYNNSRNDVHSIDDDDDDVEDDEDDDSAQGNRKQEETETDKGLWDKKLHYIWLGFGVAFNIRNVISFPALVTRHGGGAFLFTYVVLTFTLGIPLIYLEVSLGQYTRGGVVKAWGIMPLAKGICMSSMLFTLISTIYSASPPTWALYYLYLALAGRTPYLETAKPNNISMTTTVPSLSSSRPTVNQSAFQPCLNKTDHFFHQHVLQASSSIVSFGPMVPHLVICLTIIWVIVLCYASLGLRRMGKISFLFTVIPSILLFITTIGICTLSGSVLGIRTFLNPRWKHLGQVQVWLDSLELVLSSLASGTGVFITLSGHSNFHGNTFRNAMLMTTLSVLMTTMCGCLMLAAMGVQSTLTGKDIADLGHSDESGYGFVVLPTVILNLSTPGFWNGIFYTSLVLLSVGRMALFIITLHQGVFDFAHVEDPRPQTKQAVLGVLVAIPLALSLMTTTQNGVHIHRLLRMSIPRLVSPLICVAQCVTIGWGYGARRFAGRVSEMTGKNKSFVWKWLWRWGCPVVLAVSVLTSLLTTNVTEILPPTDSSRKWLHAIGWLISATILLPGITMATVSFCKVRGTLKQRLKQLRSTPASWGPGHPEHEPQADLPDYVICHPDPFRPANALAMLTANLYLPNIVNFVNMKSSNNPDMSPGYLSDLATLSSSDDEGSIDVPTSKKGFFGRCHATVGCLGHVVGLGNLVRFPYLAYRHGGGAFLLAYLVLLLTCGFPLMVIETAVGQFSSLGPIGVWRAVPFFKGIGFAMICISFATSVYYGVVTSYAVYYSATALTSAMPWQYCDNSWNTNSCSIIVHSTHLCKTTNVSSYMNQTSCADGVTNCFRPNSTTASPCAPPSQFVGNLSTSMEEYFYLSVVKMSNGLNEPGQMRWQLVLCLLLLWSTVVISLVKGSKPRSKTVYLIFTFIISLLLILLIRCSSLPGGNNGLRHLFTPDWSRFTSGHVWRDAASQVFFSLSLGSGSIIAQSTYNKFNNHIFREAGLLCIADTCISVLASLVIFAVVGAISHSVGTDMNDTLKADIGMPFIALSHAGSQMPWSVFWAVCIFIVLVIGGVTTCTSSLATVIVAVTDVFRTSLKKQRIWLLLSLAVGAVLIGMPFCIQAGFYVIGLFDLYLSGLPQLAICGATVVAFSWIYGGTQLSNDIARMINAPIGLWWRIICGVICPGFLAGAFVVSITSLLSNGDHPHHPAWATALGLVLWFLLISPVFVGMANEVCCLKTGPWLQRVRRSCQPRKGWGASSYRAHGHIEYFPTVHTHLGIELDRDCVNTITDRVEFTTVGVRVPSLSQTTLLPLSPKTPRNKRPMDMRHKAILNHAYSNPQCNLSSVSLEKAGKKKRHRRTSSSNHSADSIIVSRKSNQSVDTCDVSTQTDAGWLENKLRRQQSQPHVAVTPPVRVLARSLSWHCINGEPAILKVNLSTHGRQDSDPKIDVLNYSRKTDDNQDISYLQHEEKHQEHPNVQLNRKSLSDNHEQPEEVKPKMRKKGTKPRQQSPSTSMQQPASAANSSLKNGSINRSFKRRRRMGQSNAPNLGLLLTSMNEQENGFGGYGVSRSLDLESPPIPELRNSTISNSLHNLTDMKSVLNETSIVSKRRSSTQVELKQGDTFRKSAPRSKDPVAKVVQSESQTEYDVRASNDKNEMNNHTAYHNRERGENVGSGTTSSSVLQKGFKTTVARPQSDWCHYFPMPDSSPFPVLPIQEYISLDGNGKRISRSGCQDKQSKIEDSMPCQSRGVYPDMDANSNCVGFWDLKNCRFSRETEKSSSSGGVIMEEEEEEVALEEVLGKADGCTNINVTGDHRARIPSDVKNDDGSTCNSYVDEKQMNHL